MAAEFSRVVYSGSVVQERKIILAGEHVALAEMAAEDQPFFQKWHEENAELRALIGDHAIPTMKDQNEWFERSKHPDRRMFSIVVTEDQQLIGHGGFVDINQEKHTAQLRITIGHSEYWGRGLGTEATKLLVEYGFGKMNLTSIWLRVLPDNKRAIRSYGKVGFLNEGKELFRDQEVVRMRILS